MIMFIKHATRCSTTLVCGLVVIVCLKVTSVLSGQFYQARHFAPFAGLLRCRVHWRVCGVCAPGTSLTSLELVEWVNVLRQGLN